MTDNLKPADVSTSGTCHELGVSALNCVRACVRMSERLSQNYEQLFNFLLEETSKGENIVKWIKGRRISWLAYLERMEEDRMPKKIFTQELEGTRRRGRPRKRWKEEVERDLQALRVRRWRELVADRKKWKDIVRHTKAHCEL